MIDGLTADHLRAHVAELLLECVDVGLLGATGGLRDAEVDELYAALVANDNVGGRQVAVDDAGCFSARVL